MAKQTNQPLGLILVLLNASAPLGDRHDAAMELAAFDAPEVEAALLRVVLNLSEDEEIADAARESLWSIWDRSGQSKANLAEIFHPAARKFFFARATLNIIARSVGGGVSRRVTHVRRDSGPEWSMGCLALQQNA